MLKATERNTAMELHRKKLLSIPMTVEEDILNTFYKRQTILYTRGLKLIWWITYLHLLILAAEDGFDTRPIYYLAIPSLFIYIGSYTEMDQPYCVNTSSFFSSDKEETLLYIQAYQHQVQSKALNDEEQRRYNEDNAICKWYSLKLFAIQFGVIAAVVLDVWFSIIYIVENFF